MEDKTDGNLSACPIRRGSIAAPTHGVRDTQNALVSVIVPLYNCKCYVEAAVSSVLAQSYRPLEIVIVDDCSTDGSRDIARRIAEENALVHLLQLPRNAGQAYARNRGVEVARGNYITFFDADDLMLSERIETDMSILMEDDGVSLAFSDYRRLVDERVCEQTWFSQEHVKALMDSIPKRDIGGGRYVFLRTVGSELKKHLFITLPVTVRRSAFANACGFDDALTGVEDFDLWLRMCERGMRFGYSKRDLFRYRILSRSTMRSTRGVVMHVAYYSHLLNREEDSTVRRVLRKRVFIRLFDIGYREATQGHGMQALSYYLRSLAYAGARSVLSVAVAILKIPYHVIRREG